MERQKTHINQRYKEYNLLSSVAISKRTAKEANNFLKRNDISN